MTRYAIDEARGELLASWETGYGGVATRVASLSDDVPAAERRALAAGRGDDERIIAGRARRCKADLHGLGDSSKLAEKKLTAL